eukprot:2769360-Amphidinium_carterae.1
MVESSTSSLTATTEWASDEAIAPHEGSARSSWHFLDAYWRKRALKSPLLLLDGRFLFCCQVYGGTNLCNATTMAQPHLSWHHPPAL